MKSIYRREVHVKIFQIQESEVSRQNNMGILKKGKNWFIDYYDAHRRRKREKIGPSKKLAQEVLSKRKVQIAEGKYLDIRRDEKIKFTDFAKTYIEIHAKPNKKSWRSDQTSLNHLIPFFGSKYLYEITHFMIEKYKNQRAESVKPASVNRELACLKCMFSKAILWDKMRDNPVRKVRLFKENNQRVRYLDGEELKKLLANCQPKLLPLVIVDLNTGMRKSEIRYLKWERLQFNDSGGFITLLDTKGGGKRILPMNKIVRKILLSIKKHPNSAYVFYGVDGRPYDFRSSFETVIKKSGILNFRFHDLRHTFASYLAMKGVDLNTIRELMGHKSIEMTLRYAHLSPDHKSRAVNVLDDQMDTFWTPEAKLTEKQESVESLTPLFPFS